MLLLVRGVYCAYKSNTSLHMHLVASLRHACDWVWWAIARAGLRCSGSPSIPVPADLSSTCHHHLHNIVFLRCPTTLLATGWQAIWYAAVWSGFLVGATVLLGLHVHFAHGNHGEGHMLWHGYSRRLEGLPIGLTTWPETLAAEMAFGQAYYTVVDAWSPWVRSPQPDYQS